MKEALKKENVLEAKAAEVARKAAAVRAGAQAQLQAAVKDGIEAAKAVENDPWKKGKEVVQQEESSEAPPPPSASPAPPKKRAPHRHHKKRHHPVPMASLLQDAATEAA